MVDRDETKMVSLVNSYMGGLSRLNRDVYKSRRRKWACYVPARPEIRFDPFVGEFDSYLRGMGEGVSYR